MSRRPSARRGSADEDLADRNGFLYAADDGPDC